MATNIPAPPARNEDPWFDKRDAFDQAVRTRLNEELSDAALDASIAGLATEKNTIVFDASTFGDLATDAAGAINAAIAAAPGTASLGGVDILIPFGDWLVSSTILVNKPGVRLVGAGGYTTRLRANPALTGPMIRYASTNSFLRGPQAENLRLSPNGANCNALVFEGAYDNATLQNVFVDGVTGTNWGIAFIPAPGAPSPVSQTIIAINCYVVGATGFTGHAWHLDNVQEMTLLGCKGKGGGEGLGTSFYIKDCRGVQFYGCSAAISNIGFEVVTSARSVVGLTIDGPTVEGVTSTVTAVGTASTPIGNISLRNVRKQIASTIDAGPINLTYVTNSVIESGALVVNVNSGCAQVHVFTEDMTKVTDAGSRTSMIAWENSAARLGLRGQTGVSLYVGPNEVIRTVNAGTNQAGIVLATNTGSGVVMKQVLIGAPDSGGSGQRTLTIPN